VHGLISIGAEGLRPHIDPADFTTTIDNEYLSPKPGTTFVYQGAQSAAR
jgi:hypothetical protein